MQVGLLICFDLLNKWITPIRNPYSGQANVQCTNQIHYKTESRIATLTSEYYYFFYWELSKGNKQKCFHSNQIKKVTLRAKAQWTEIFFKKAYYTYRSIKKELIKFIAAILQE